MKRFSRNKTTIIAEVGVNHNGNLQMAIELVDKAAEAGADYVKFQTFSAKKIATSSAKKAKYQLRSTDVSETQLNMLQNLELSYDDHRALVHRCNVRGISFLSTPFDEESLVTLTRKFGLPEIKLGSGENTNAPLLLAAGRSGVKIILSTGMSSLSEVEEALGVIAFGMCRKTTPASRKDFSDILLDPDVWLTLRERVTLMHCTTEYPAPVADTNLLAMKTLEQAFGVKVGYSDHTSGDCISLAAVTLGACVIEKHFTLDRSLDGPDHAASLEPKELQRLVTGIRSIELALGNGIKQPSLAEVSNRSVARKSLVAARDITKGTILKIEDIEAKRSYPGISPMDFWDTVGRETKKSYNKDENI